MTDEWRRWIAENVMLGASRDSILKVMVAGRSFAVRFRRRDRPGRDKPLSQGGGAVV